MIQFEVMDTVKLINNVQSRKSLWDRTDKQYHNRDVSRDLWHEVCLELGLDPATAMDTVKKRWNSLRDVFRREYIKATKNETNTSVWFYYDNMSFLIPQMRPPRPITVELVDSQDYEEYEENSTETFEYHKDTAQTPTKRILLQEEIVTAENHYEHRLNHKQSRKDEGPDSGTTDDSDYHFLMSMLPFLQALPLRKKMATRIKILQTLQAADEETHTDVSEADLNSPDATITRAEPSDKVINLTFKKSPESIDDESYD